MASKEEPQGDKLEHTSRKLRIRIDIFYLQLANKRGTFHILHNIKMKTRRFILCNYQNIYEKEITLSLITKDRNVLNARKLLFQLYIYFDSKFYALDLLFYIYWQHKL